MHQTQHIGTQSAPTPEYATGQVEIVNVLLDIPATLASAAPVRQTVPVMECVALLATYLYMTDLIMIRQVNLREMGLAPRIVTGTKTPLSYVSVIRAFLERIARLVGHFPLKPSSICPSNLIF